MIKNKPALLEEMQDLENVLKMYKDAFPENPIWAQAGTKDKKKAKVVEE
jgi:hypothetical protein